MRRFAVSCCIRHDMELTAIICHNKCAMSDPTAIQSDNVGTSTAQSKRFCVTWFNYTDSTIVKLTDLFNSSKLRYVVIGEETCPETQRKHLQIYLETTKKITFRGLKDLLGDNAIHVEIAKGDAQSNLEYCSKEKLLLLLGKPVKKGQRTDLEAVKELIDSGTSYESLWDSNFSIMLQYRRGLEEYSNLRRLRRRGPPLTSVHWGPTGTGKTRYAFDLARDDYDDSFWVWPGGEWFDGYRGQKVAIFDEFHGGSEQRIPFSLWKKLVDRYPLQVPVKGGFTNWSPEVIVFTSNIDPKFWWPEEKMLPKDWRDQFDRRITSIVDYTPANIPPQLPYQE